MSNERFHPQGSRHRRVVLGLLIFLATWYLYRESPVFQFGDAAFTLLASTSLVDGHGLAVEAYLPPSPDSGRLPYNLTTGRDHVLPWYPPGTAVLSAPLLLGMKPLGYGAVDAEGLYDRQAERRAVHHLGPFVVALFVLLVYFLASELLPVTWAAGITVFAALGTPAWSSLSRNLWSHNWFVVLVIIAIWLLVRAELRGRPPTSAALATLLSWAFFVRPTAALVLVAVGIYLLVRWRATVLHYAVVAGLWGAAFIGWSWSAYGTLVPPYYSLGWRVGRDCGVTLSSALAGVLAAPSRGILIFCPWILLMVWLLWRYRRHVRLPALSHIAWPLCVAQIWIIAASPRWWGGYSYGPRLMGDVLPWLLLLLMLAADAWRRGRTRETGQSRSIEVALATSIALLTIALHAPGALSERTHRWNDTTRCELGQRVWDWSEPQFLAWWPRVEARLTPGSPGHAAPATSRR